MTSFNYFLLFQVKPKQSQFLFFILPWNGAIKLFPARAAKSAEMRQDFRKRVSTEIFLFEIFSTTYSEFLSCDWLYIRGRVSAPCSYSATKRTNAKQVSSYEIRIVNVLGCLLAKFCLNLKSSKILIQTYFHLGVFF